MGLRDKIRERLGRDRRGGSRDTGASGEMRRSLAQLRARAAQLEAEAAAPGTDEDQRVKDQFRQAERTATVGAPVQASLEPINPPQRMAQTARAEQRDRTGLEELAMGSRAKDNRRERDRDDLGTMPILAFDESDDRDDDQWRLL